MFVATTSLAHHPRTVDGNSESEVVGFQIDFDKRRLWMPTRYYLLVVDLCNGEINQNCLRSSGSWVKTPKSPEHRLKSPATRRLSSPNLDFVHPPIWHVTLVSYVRVDHALPETSCVLCMKIKFTGKFICIHRPCIITPSGLPKKALQPSSSSIRDPATFLNLPIRGD